MEGRDYRGEAARQRAQKRRNLDQDRRRAFETAMGSGKVRVSTDEHASVQAAKAGARAHREHELQTILADAAVEDAKKPQKWTDAEVVDQT